MLDGVDTTGVWGMISYSKLLFVTFSLERKSNQKVQGQPDRSARLSGQRLHFF